MRPSSAHPKPVTTRPESVCGAEERISEGRTLCRPLCPAGHLPHEGGDQPTAWLSPIADVAERAVSAKLPISPRVGEMSGRAEGGDIECDFQS